MKGIQWNRLAVNSGKTQVMFSASSQKRRILRNLGDESIEGKLIAEMKAATILGIIWKHGKTTWQKKFGEKAKGIAQVIHYFKEKRRKEVVEGVRLSTI